MKVIPFEYNLLEILELDQEECLLLMDFILEEGYVDIK